MKKSKIFLVVLLAITMVFSLAACKTDSSSSSSASQSSSSASEESSQSEVSDSSSSSEVLSASPIDRITEGQYCYKFTAEGHGEYAFFFNFYEEDPVMGAVFYAGFSNNRANFAGTYTVEELDYEYSVYPDRETEQSDAAPTEGIAPYTVTFYDWDGKELGSCGFDGDILYNDMGKNKDGDVYVTGSAPYTYLRDEDGEFADVVAGELGVPYASFVADDEPTSTLELYHNFTYADLVDAMVEGTWKAAKNAGGGYDFSLTPDDSSDTGAVVSASADRKTCTYTPEGGEAVAMSDPNAGAPAVAYLFEGSFRVEAYKVDAAVVMNLFDDESCVITADVAGNEMVLDKGTYKLDGHTFEFEFENGENGKSNVDASGTMTVDIKVSNEKLGDVETTLTLNKE